MYNNVYYNDYLNNYITLRDIPYLFWTHDIVELALKREPINYYELLIDASIHGKTTDDPLKCLERIPMQYRSTRIYKKLFEAHIITDLKKIPKILRTPSMYKSLSKRNFNEYLVSVVEEFFPNSRELTAEEIISNIDLYINRIPNEYKSVELCEMLINKDFQKYFKVIPEECRTTWMYEEYVKLNPQYIENVPVEKRNEKMYSYLFDTGFDNYFDMIPEKYRTKEMYHKLLHINHTAYFPRTPIEYLDEDICAYLIGLNVTYLDLIPEGKKTEGLYLNLIKKDAIRFLKYIPSKYFNDEFITKVANIIALRQGNRKFVEELEINDLLIKNNPKLLKHFSSKIINRVIKDELCNLIISNGDITDLKEKYGLSNKSIISVLNDIKENDINLHNNIQDYLNTSSKRKNNTIRTDINNLEKIIKSFNKLSRHKLTTDDKIKLGYLIGKYIKTPLEIIYSYNNSYSRVDANDTVNNFIEYVLDYSVIIDKYEGISNAMKITYNNGWLKQFDFNEFFNIKDGRATSVYKYGLKEEVLTFDIAHDIINRLVAEEIPLNYLVVTVAFRRYYKGELDQYIKELHEYDNVIIKTKRKER